MPFLPPQDALGAKKANADGIGLFRTEFVFMGRTEPSTEESSSSPIKRLRALSESAARSSSVHWTSLRAILRASAYGNIKLMYPMISTLQELREANRLLAEAKGELDARNQTYHSDMEVGIMV